MRYSHRYNSRGIYLRAGQAGCRASKFGVVQRLSDKSARHTVDGFVDNVQFASKFRATSNGDLSESSWKPTVSDALNCIKSFCRARARMRTPNHLLGRVHDSLAPAASTADPWEFLVGSNSCVFGADAHIRRLHRALVFIAHGQILALSLRSTALPFPGEACGYARN
jgi:hypothetical protein